MVVQSYGRDRQLVCIKLKTCRQIVLIAIRIGLARRNDEKKNRNNNWIGERNEGGRCRVFAETINRYAKQFCVCTIERLNHDRIHEWWFIMLGEWKCQIPTVMYLWLWSSTIVTHKSSCQIGNSVACYPLSMPMRIVYPSCVSFRNVRNLILNFASNEC